MIAWAMRRLAPGGFAWLTLAELRTAWASRPTGWQQGLSTALMSFWILVGLAAGLALREVPIPGGPLSNAIFFVTGAAMLAFMITQGMLGSQRTLYEAGDLDLLFSAPMPPRIVVAAKLSGIVAAVLMTYAVLILPILLPIALLGHPGLLGAALLIVALALVGGCVGLGLTLALARLAGPRAARTVGQIVAALAGGSVFVATQFYSGPGRDMARGADRDPLSLFDRLAQMDLLQHGPATLPGRAALGDPLALALILGIGIAVFALTAWAMQRWFLAGYQAGRMRLGGRTRAARTAIAGHFRTSLFAATFAKEWRLLARDPALLFQVLMRLIYLAPFFFIAGNAGGEIGLLAPSLAFANVLVAGQLVASLAWLTVAAEDTPDLIAVAPVDKGEIEQSKLMAALAMAAPIGLILPVVIALHTPLGGAITLGATALTGWLVGSLEVANAKPAPRSTFQRRGQGSWLSALLGFLIAGILGLITAGAVYFATLLG